MFIMCISVLCLCECADTLDVVSSLLDSVILFVSHDITLLNNLPNIMLHLKDGKLTEYKGNYDDFLEQYELRQMGKIAELKNIQNKTAINNKYTHAKSVNE